MDVRRMQSLVSDLGEPDQGVLMPALKHLVSSPTLAGALQRTPPLADARLMAAILQEMEGIYAPSLCVRIDVVTRALFACPDTPTPPPVAAASPPPLPVSAAPPPLPVTRAAGPAATLAKPAGPASETAAAWGPMVPAVAAPPPPARAGGGGGSAGLVAVLAFLSGLLLMATVAMALWLRSGSRTPLAPAAVPAPVAGTAATGAAPPSPSPAAPSPSPSPAPTETAPAPSAADGVALEQAVATVQNLYAALSEKNFDAAAALLRSGTAPSDQFDPDFFRQFERVSVADLRETGRDGSSVNLEGQVSFLYPDGTSQVETRSFSVNTATSPAQITASSFIAVLRPRG